VKILEFTTTQMGWLYLWFTLTVFGFLIWLGWGKYGTIRQLIVAECIGGSIRCWAVFAILGNTGLFFELNGVVPVTEILQRDGAPAAIVAIR
jgi:BCCT family betaine/carnitine transporter